MSIELVGAGRTVPLLREKPIAMDVPGMLQVITEAHGAGGLVHAVEEARS